MNDAPSPTLAQVLEALLFAAPKPLTARQLAAYCARGAEAAGPSPAEAQAAEGEENPAPAPEGEEILVLEGAATEANPLAGTTEAQVREALALLADSYAAESRGLWIQEVGGGFRLGTRPEVAPWVRRLFDESKPAKLSQPAMETLAIIAYRQPISRADVEAVRGVAVDGVVATLQDRRLIRLAGRSDTPGRPLLYETTQEFLELFGLRTLDELPNAAELRHVPTPAASPAEMETQPQEGGDAAAEEAPVHDEEPQAAADPETESDGLETDAEAEAEAEPAREEEPTPETP
ncbi:MAG: SMC-Scp complex subunit ScpB [Verrucomicrobium sp.]|nr:SMC-Scp complex subunit ScpB [Verrucomicrobium sp.]